MAPAILPAVGEDPEKLAAADHPVAQSRVPAVLKIRAQATLEIRVQVHPGEADLAGRCQGAHFQAQSAPLGYSLRPDWPDRRRQAVPHIRRLHRGSE